MNLSKLLFKLLGDEAPASPQETDVNVKYPFENMGIARAFEPTDFIVFDVETTGFSPQDDKIIEISAVKIKKGQMTRFHSLVNPGRRIPKRTIEVHGITDAMVSNAPPFKKIAKQLDVFLEPELPIVGHNVQFDLRILWWEYHDAGRSLGARRFVDTYPLAKKAFPGRSSYSLASLIHDYELIPGEQTHRTDSDVDATLALYGRCWKVLRG